MSFNESSILRNHTQLGSGEWIRNRAYWLRDRFMGSAVINQLNDLDALLRKPDYRGNERDRRLHELLKHARETVPFYADYPDATTLKDFPVITKENLKRDYDHFFSNSFSRDQLTPMSTTGSYGTPFTFYLSPEKRARQLAEIIYFSNWAGYRVGMKYVQMRGTSHKKLRSLLQNEILINPWLIDDDWYQSSRYALRQKNVRFLFEYPSPMVYLANYCRKQGDSPDDFDIIGACTSSENLTSEMKTIIQSTFGGVILSRYASQENGVIGHEHPDYGSKMLINEASIFLEFLELHSDKPVEPGQVGRIVVTDLYSHAMPLIRYDIGDTGILSSDVAEESGLSMIERLEGRIIERLTSVSGETVSPYLIVTGLWGVEGIIQCQFVQKDSDRYLMRLVVEDKFDGEQDVLNRLTPYLGETARISFEYLDQIEPQKKSGKRPQVINEWKSQ